MYSNKITALCATLTLSEEKGTVQFVRGALKEADARKVTDVGPTVPDQHQHLNSAWSVGKGKKKVGDMIFGDSMINADLALDIQVQVLEAMYNTTVIESQQITKSSDSNTLAKGDGSVSMGFTLGSHATLYRISPPSKLKLPRWKRLVRREQQ
ncbi:hypothetical protein ACOSQ3_005169 [Xanthoceras sorbifolium]